MPRRARALNDQIVPVSGQSTPLPSALCVPWAYWRAALLSVVRFHCVAACRSPTAGSRRCSILGKSSLLRHAGMSALGQKQTYAVQNGMSALPPIATAKADFPHVCFTPTSRHVHCNSSCLLWANSGHLATAHAALRTARSSMGCDVLLRWL